MHTYKFSYKHGQKLRVLRPANPTLALEMAQNYIGKIPDNEKNFLDFIAEKCGPMTDLGFLGRAFFNKKPVILNDKGEKIGDVAAGDFFSVYYN